MPDVKMELEVAAPMERVWTTVLDIERYSDVMENVRWAKVLTTNGASERTCAWSVTLKGSILEWEEVEHIDHDARVVEFHQLRGDMQVFEGRWTLEPRGPGATHVAFDVAFEIGIPLLAEMLNPVAQRSLRENCTEMLRGIEREALAA
jgi:ribosome-associated toxin RatA of RatAB toxin-antitoxin module